MRTIKTAPFLSLAAASLITGLSSAPALAEAGLPQLDPSTFAPQVIWLVISFAVLYVVMSRVALPKVSEVLEQRSIMIEGNLKKAEDLKAEAEAAQTAYEEALATARANAHERIKEVRDAAAAESQKRSDDLGAKLTDQVQKAEANIAEAKAKAMGGIKAMAEDVAAAAAEKLTGEAPDSAKLGAAVDAAMKE